MDVAEGHDFLEHINPHSLEEVPALLEPSVADAQAGFRCQFERTGYFCVDKDSSNGSLILNKT